MKLFELIGRYFCPVSRGQIIYWNNDFYIVDKIYSKRFFSAKTLTRDSLIFDLDVDEITFS